MSEETPEYNVSPPVSKRRTKPKADPTPAKKVAKATKTGERKVPLPPAKEREVPTPTPLSAWAGDEIRRAELANLLRAPIIQEALSTLRAAYEAEIPPLVSGKNSAVTIPNATDLNNLLALRSSHRAGFFGAFNALVNLTSEKILRRSNMNPWGDLVPDED
jgi:hypothetical protein